MIEILNRQKKSRIDPGRFERLLKKLVRHYELNRPEIDAGLRRRSRDPGAEPEIPEKGQADRRPELPSQ